MGKKIDSKEREKESLHCYFLIEKCTKQHGSIQESLAMADSDGTACGFQKMMGGGIKVKLYT